MTTTNSTQPTPTCRCGGTTRYIGIQRFTVLNHQRKLYDCDRCGTTLAGDKEPLTDVEAVKHGNE